MAAGSQPARKFSLLAGWSRAGYFIRQRIFVGLKYLAPFLITAFVVAWIYNAASDVLRPFFFGTFERLIPGVALLIMILVPLGVGILVMHSSGVRVLRVFEFITQRIPLVGSIFNVTKEISDALDPVSKTGFNRVVQIEYPRKGVWAIGFLTSIVHDEEDTEMGVVFIPTAPLPSSGFIAIMPMTDIRDLNLNATDAMRLVLSSGVVSPEKLR